MMTLEEINAGKYDKQFLALIIDSNEAHLAALVSLRSFVWDMIQMEIATAAVDEMARRATAHALATLSTTLKIAGILPEGAKSLSPEWVKSFGEKVAESLDNRYLLLRMDFAEIVGSIKKEV